MSFKNQHAKNYYKCGKFLIYQGLQKPLVRNNPGVKLRKVHFWIMRSYK